MFSNELKQRLKNQMDYHIERALDGSCSDLKWIDNAVKTTIGWIFAEQLENFLQEINPKMEKAIEPPYNEFININYYVLNNYRSNEDKELIAYDKNLF